VVLTIVVFAASAAVPVQAQGAADIYAAEVPPEAAGGRLADAFGEAFRRMLVKVTGSREAPDDPELLQYFGDPARLVQQYRSAADGRIWVRFDPVAVQRALDAGQYPIWLAERPTVLVWLAADLGGGQRQIVPAAGETERPAIGAPAADRTTALVEDARSAVLRVAAERGLPVLLPLVDSDDLLTVSAADIWGDFTAAVEEASARYGADTMLVGRARLFDDGVSRVRWTLMLPGGERFDWEGSVADGPENTADIFAARFATSISAARRLRLLIAGIDSFEAYGRTYRYLAGLGIVDRLAIDRVSGDAVLFELQIRGDADQLRRTLALNRDLTLVDSALIPDQSRSDLHYRLDTR